MASEVPLVWLKSVLAEHGLTVADIYSSTSDGVSDIKRLLDVRLCERWSWCVPHLANRSLNEGMGFDENSAECQNEEARAEINKVVSFVEHVSKSSEMHAKFQELQVSVACASFGCSW